MKTKLKTINETDLIRMELLEPLINRYRHYKSKYFTIDNFDNIVHFYTILNKKYKVIENDFIFQFKELKSRYARDVIKTEIDMSIDYYYMRITLEKNTLDMDYIDMDYIECLSNYFNLYLIIESPTENQLDLYIKMNLINNKAKSE